MDFRAVMTSLIQVLKLGYRRMTVTGLPLKLRRTEA